MIKSFAENVRKLCDVLGADINIDWLMHNNLITSAYLVREHAWTKRSRRNNPSALSLKKTRKSSQASAARLLHERPLDSRGRAERAHFLTLDTARRHRSQSWYAAAGEEVSFTLLATGPYRPLEPSPRAGKDPFQCYWPSHFICGHIINFPLIFPHHKTCFICLFFFFCSTCWFTPFIFDNVW